MKKNVCSAVLKNIRRRVDATALAGDGNPSLRCDRWKTQRGMLMRRSLFAVAVLAGFLCSSRVGAQELDEKKTEKYVSELGAIVVSAKGPDNSELKPLNNSRNEISAEQIQKYDCNTLNEALLLAPSVSLMNTGARAEKKIMVRGFSTREVPLFVDGIPVYVPYDGLLDPSRFLTLNTRSIELEKGFNSVMNGPNTLGGAINMRSVTPVKPLEGEVEAGVFSGGGYKSNFRVGSAQDRFYAQVEGGYITQNGFPLSHDFSGGANGETGGRRDHSGYEDWVLSAKAGMYTDRGDEYMVRYIHQEGQKEQPVTADPADTKPRYWEWPVWNKETVYFIGRTMLTADSYIQSKLFLDQYGNELASYKNAAFTNETSHSVYDDYSLGGGADWVTEGIEDHLLKAGLSAKQDVHREHDEVDLTQASWVEDSDLIWSLGAEDAWRFRKKWLLVTGVSYDYLAPDKATDSNAATRGKPLPTSNSDALNPQAGLWYTLTTNNEIYVTAAHKTRFPTLKDRYSYRLGKAIPNPDLNEEQANHFETGWKGNFDPVDFSASVFYSDVKDTIALVDNVAGPGIGQMQNIGDSTISGVELGSDAKLCEMASLRVQYTYMQEQLKGNNPTLRHREGIPEHEAQIRLDLKPVKKLTLSPSFVWNSGFYESANGNQIDGFGLFNLDASYDLTERIRLQAGVHNLLDKNYVLNTGYPEEGRSLYASLRYSF